METNKKSLKEPKRAFCALAAIVSSIVYIVTLLKVKFLTLFSMNFCLDGSNLMQSDEGKTVAWGLGTAIFMCLFIILGALRVSKKLTIIGLVLLYLSCLLVIAGIGKFMNANIVIPIMFMILTTITSILVIKK